MAWIASAYLLYALWGKTVIAVKLGQA